MKTMSEWEKYFGIRVMDADGFNRMDYDPSRLYTKKEFEAGMITSTIEVTPGGRVDKVIQKASSY